MVWLFLITYTTYRYDRIKESQVPRYLPNEKKKKKNHYKIDTNQITIENSKFIIIIKSGKIKIRNNNMKTVWFPFFVLAVQLWM